MKWTKEKMQLTHTNISMSRKAEEYDEATARQDRETVVVVITFSCHSIAVLSPQSNVILVDSVAII
jgi:hypothetical protein